MYFITAQDPNYTIKGSRDPLGFQVIWQDAGRKLIPFLSTVSNNIIDFQILCLGFAIKKIIDIPDDQFEAFFIRFEQLMAYTRYEKDSGKGFNGVDKVRRIRAAGSKEVQISNNIQHQILSNQRSYGIWGKYIRPFTDMKMLEDADFDLIFGKKAQSCKELIQLCLSLKKKTSDTAYVNLQKLLSLQSLLNKPEGAEKTFFIRYLLKDNFHNELLKLITTSVKVNGLRFYQLLDILTRHSDDSSFKGALEFIKNTEFMLSPLNHIFRYLQTTSYMSYEDINKDDYISKWRSSIDTSGFDSTSVKLASLHQVTNEELVSGLANRNQEVCNWRHSAPWIQLMDKGIEVNHFEGGYLSEGYDPITDYDNTYFLSSYFTLSSQLL